MPPPPMRQNDFIPIEPAGQLINILDRHGDLSRIRVSYGFTGVDHYREIVLSTDLHDRFESIRKPIFKTSVVTCQHAYAGKPAVNAALGFGCGVCVAWIQAAKPDEALILFCHHLHDVIVVQFDAGRIFPRKSEKNRFLNTVFIHGRNQVLSPYHFRFRRTVQKLESGVG